MITDATCAKGDEGESGAGPLLRLSLPVPCDPQEPRRLSRTLGLLLVVALALTLGCGKPSP